jgi:hypothetical protein
MIVFNTYDNTYLTGYVPGDVSEIVCDNSSFARSTYTTTSARDIKTTSLKLYPNPAGKTIALSDINTPAGETQVSIFSMNGQLVFKENVSFSSSVTLDVSSLKSGAYLLKIISNEGVETRKLIVNENLK